MRSAWVVIASLTAFACAAPPAAPPPTAATSSITGFSAAAAERQRAIESELAATLDAASVDAEFRELTRLPHVAGSERTREIAEMIAQRFRDYGFDEVRLHRYDVWLPTPREVRVEMPATGWSASLREDPYEADPDTAVDIGPAWIGMSASGDVTGELIYAHSGNPEDYDWLVSQGIDPAGKIAIVRYSVPYSYRGFKAWEAERRGVKGLLIYTDPKEDGHLKGAVYPDGPWGPESHIQRGAITYDFIIPGDPLTPGWASTDDARRIDVADAVSVPGIIAVPMSYRDAQPMLEALGGPEAPESWVGGLPITYRAGGAGVQARVKVDMDERQRPIWVAEGRLFGAELRDELVVLGNHHDAWVYGGVDPSSGTATMLELARALGAMAEQGTRPRRTLVFGAWDAEEWHLTGSTEWGEQFAVELGEQAVAYLNVDSSVSGGAFGASAVASLNRLVIETARDVADPSGEGSILERWRSRDEGGDSVIATAARGGARTGGDLDLVANALGSGSDYTVFLNHLGIPVVDMSFEGPYGVYHSLYDDYWRMTELIDPGLVTMTRMAEVWGRMALRLANAQVLPYDLGLYARRVSGFLDALESLPGAEALDLTEARQILGQWELAGDTLHGARENALVRGLDPDRTLEVNRALMQVERELLLATRVAEGVYVADGIPGRPWFRHGLYAPRYTYAALSLPGVTEAIESGDPERARSELQRVVDALADALTMTRAALQALDDDAPQ